MESVSASAAAAGEQRGRGQRGRGQRGRGGLRFIGPKAKREGRPKRRSLRPIRAIEAAFRRFRETRLPVNNVGLPKRRSLSLGGRFERLELLSGRSASGSV